MSVLVLWSTLPSLFLPTVSSSAVGKNASTQDKIRYRILFFVNLLRLWSRLERRKCYRRKKIEVEAKQSSCFLLWCSFLSLCFSSEVFKSPLHDDDLPGNSCLSIQCMSRRTDRSIQASQSLTSFQVSFICSMRYKRKIKQDKDTEARKERSLISEDCVSELFPSVKNRSSQNRLFANYYFLSSFSSVFLSLSHRLTAGEKNRTRGRRRHTQRIVVKISSFSPAKMNTTEKKKAWERNKRRKGQEKVRKTQERNGGEGETIERKKKETQQEKSRGRRGKILREKETFDHTHRTLSFLPLQSSFLNQEVL